MAKFSFSAAGSLFLDKLLGGSLFSDRHLTRLTTLWGPTSCTEVEPL